MQWNWGRGQQGSNLAGQKQCSLSEIYGVEGVVARALQSFNSVPQLAEALCCSFFGEKGHKSGFLCPALQRNDSLPNLQKIQQQYQPILLHCFTAANALVVKMQSTKWSQIEDLNDLGGSFWLSN